MEARTVSIEEAAEVLGISRRHAYGLAQTGALPGALRLGGRWVVVRRQLLAALGEADAERQPVTVA